MQKTDKIIYITHGAYSDTGLQREENQDAYGKYPEDDLDLRHARGQLFLIADGMGGHHHGREASDLAIKTILEYYQTSSQPIPLSLKKAIESANQAIYEKTQSTSDIVKMGTTCVALLMTQHSAYVAHVGDSRLYRINDDTFEQLTSDHTQVAEMKKHGILTDEEAENHPSKSVLVRALGVKSSVEVDMTEISPLRPDDYYLLCTDGLSKVNQDDIKTVVLNKEPQQACEILAELANQAGGHDNVTVQIVKVHALKREEVIDRQRKRHTARRVHRTAMWSLLFAVMLAVAAGLYAILSSTLIRNSSTEPNNAAVTESNIPDETQSWMNQAERLTSAGDLDSALAIYKTVLAESPMHLESLNGVQKIASLYKERGDEYRRQRLYDRALDSYRFAVSLMPANNEVRRLIALTEEYIENRPQFETTELSDADVSGFRTADSPGGSAANPEQQAVPAADVAFGGVKNSEWRFPELDSDEYQLSD
ncbi:MAG: Stp1/IreP family PP2C-type Ser/Thr phosphatase, partial [Candidatus Marinimicrobia bacterium]|nr:Stp1/IreP family PP2C-type Ser/Thr phosphatase [Candidatus Neomarinimicrobiota bacterium]